MKLKTRCQFNLGDLKRQACPLSILFQFTKSQQSQQQGKGGEAVPRPLDLLAFVGLIWAPVLFSRVFMFTDCCLY